MTAVTLPVTPALRQFSFHANLDEARLRPAGHRGDQEHRLQSLLSQSCSSHRGKPSDHLGLAFLICKTEIIGTSLVAQWLRIRLLMQGTRV